MIWVFVVLLLGGACVGAWRVSGRPPVDTLSGRDGDTAYLRESDLAHLRQERGRRFLGRR